MIESLPLSHTQKMISTQDAGPARGRWETLLGQGTQLRRQGPGPMLTRATSERFLTTPTQPRPPPLQLSTLHALNTITTPYAGS